MREGMQARLRGAASDNSTRRAGLRVALLWGVLASLPACESARLVDPVPLSVRNQHPAQLTSMHAGARPGAALAKGALELEASAIWSSLWLRPGAGQDRIELDGELLRVEPGLRVGLGQGFELALRVPLLATSGGELDGFLEAWHDAFDLPQNQRNEFERGRFVVRADRQSSTGLQTAWELRREGFDIADLPIEVAWFPVGAARGESGATGGATSGAGPWSLGFRVGVELPTGDEDAGYGNGGVDWMLGFAGAYRAERWALSFWGGHTWTARPEIARAAGLPWGDIRVLGVAGELALTDRLSALAQVEWESSVLDALDESHADSDQVLLWLGGRWAFSERSSLELSVGEDLIRSVSPDVSFALGFRHRL